MLVGLILDTAQHTALYSLRRRTNEQDFLFLLNTWAGFLSKNQETKSCWHMDLRGGLHVAPAFTPFAFTALLVSGRKHLGLVFNQSHQYVTVVASQRRRTGSAHRSQSGDQV